MKGLLGGASLTLGCVVPALLLVLLLAVLFQLVFGT